MGPDVERGCQERMCQTTLSSNWEQIMSYWTAGKSQQGNPISTNGPNSRTIIVGHPSLADADILSKVFEVLLYLLSLIDKRFSHTSITVYLTVILAYNPPVDGYRVFSNLETKLFPRGLLRWYPVTKHPSPPWHLPLTLRNLTKKKNPLNQWLNMYPTYWPKKQPF